MKSLAITTVAAILLLQGCSASGPKCSDARTIELVRKIFRQGVEKQFAVGQLSPEPVLKDTEVSLTTIRTVSYDEKIGKSTCEAVLEVRVPVDIEPIAGNPMTKMLIGNVEIKGDTVRHDIQYSAQLTDDRDQLLVWARGHEPVVHAILALNQFGVFSIK